MKIKFTLIFLVSILFSFAFINNYSLASENTTIETIEDLKKYNIISEYNEDVTGDNINDKILLLAINIENTDDIKSSVKICVIDGATSKYVIKCPGYFDSGYNPKISFGDINKDGIKEILISINSGGSCSFSFQNILSFKNLVPSEVIDSKKFNRGLNYIVTLKDNYYYEVKNLELNKLYGLKLKNPSKYPNAYDAKGTITSSVIGSYIPGYYKAELVDVDKDGIVELVTYQKIIGFSNDNTIAIAEGFFKYENGSLQLKDLKIISV